MLYFCALTLVGLVSGASPLRMIHALNKLATASCLASAAICNGSGYCWPGIRFSSISRMPGRWSALACPSAACIALAERAGRERQTNKASARARRRVDAGKTLESAAFVPICQTIVVQGGASAQRGGEIRTLFRTTFKSME